MNPVITMFVGLLIFREKFGAANIAGVFITLGGLWMVIYTHTATGSHFFVGVLILFVAVIAEVSQIAFTKHLSERYSPSVIVMYQFLLGAIFFVPMFLTKGIVNFEPRLYLGWSVIYPTLSLALLCSAAAFTSWAYAISKLGVARTSVFLAIVPIVTALLCVIVGEEKLGGLQWAGLAVAMVGIYLTQREKA
jgi:drug/metabolite transporter (DMT)-like permease